ncbi:MerR family transcriptional regulator [Algihabitans albus]|uniref:MerR family transcriptional regulator n=1 Tax=Algihabitans albus TaxID=2164067 RepID=UPI000E5D15F3|nr:MerR family transcriptional regulator [Algihabitans albus]
MNASAQFLMPSEAAKRLGVSTKALRLYEQHGLIIPLRSAAGWRAYGPDDMSRAAEIVALRALGFSLAQVARVLKSDPEGLGQALAAHEATLESQMRQLAGTLEKIRGLLRQLPGGRVPTAGELTELLASAGELVVTFDLPWPWGGEQFELRHIRPLTCIIGPLGSGKTRFAKRLAEALPKAAFLGLERLAKSGTELRRQVGADPLLGSRIDQTLAWLVEDGADMTDALIALVAGLEAEGPTVLVVDMIEQGLKEAAQQAVIAHLRRRGPGERPLFLITRSSAILDLETVGAKETIILCPANHSYPVYVQPYPGSPGYEAVATCLASPEVRARTDGVVAWRPEAV